MADSFKNQSITFNTPYIGGFAITPHDSNELSNVTRGIYVGSSTNQDISVVTFDGSEIILKNVIQGQIIPVRAKKVKSTGTTATNLIGLY